MVFWKVKKKTYSETRQLEFFTCYGRSGPSCYASLYCVRIETHQTRYFVRETASLLLRSWSYLSLCKSDLLCPMHFVVLWWSRRQSFLGVPVPPVFLPRPRYLPRKITRHFDIFFFPWENWIKACGKNVANQIILPSDRNSGSEPYADIFRVCGRVLTPSWHYYCRKMCHLMSDRVVLWPRDLLGLLIIIGRTDLFCPTRQAH